MKLSFFLILLIFQASLQMDDKPARVNKLFEIYNKPGSPGATVSVIQNGKFVYQNSFGVADIRHNTKNQKDTKFLIGSVSKQFTALCIAILEVEGKLKATDSVQKYIPELNFNQVSILNLIQHTSGIKDYLNLFMVKGSGQIWDISRKEAFELIVAQKTLAFPAGTSWDYSNSGYLLMEVIIERVSKMKFHEFVKKNILDPLDMKDTILSDDNSQIVPKGSYGYLIDPVDGSFKYAPLVTNAILGAGGIQMTAQDFLKYDENFYNNQLPGGQRLIDMITTPGSFLNGTKHSYAYGLMISKSGSINIISHSEF
jgi:CubicO group peptidase (beta-lactamase class C family)